MKKSILLSLCMMATKLLFAQNNIDIHFSGAAGSEVLTTALPTTPAANVTNLPVGTLGVNVVGCPVTPSFTLLNGRTTINPAALPNNTGGTWTVFYAPGNFTSLHNTDHLNLTVNCGNAGAIYNDIFLSTLPSTGGAGGGGSTTNTFPGTSALQEIGRYFPTITPTIFGLKVTTAGIGAYPYLGDDYSHIFLDQFGNSLLGAIPQGISNRQYVVHIIYLTNGSRPSQISYSVNQTKGSFNPSLVFNNAGQIGNFAANSSGGNIAPINYVWAHQDFLLRTSTDNVEFEVSRNITDEQGLLSLQSTMVAKHTIQMSTVYHGSFDIGLLSTRLANPTFQLSSSINNPAQQVVKQSENGHRGVVTAMATFYTSPIILLEKFLLGIDVPNYKLTGRNFLDDHKIYERIFPALGVSISDRAFKNLFFGLNWELARGASFFAGIHYGEINTFRTNNNFKFEETIINEAEFNLRSNKKWKQDFAFGANLDILVVTNLLRR